MDKINSYALSAGLNCSQLWNWLYHK